MNRAALILSSLVVATGCCRPPVAPRPAVEVERPPVEAPAARAATGPDLDPADEPDPSEGLWTLLPYVVSDGMEYGPSQVLLDPAGKLRFLQVADAPAEPAGVSRLVRLETNRPLPDELREVADVSWPAWRVAEVVAERGETAAVDWTREAVSLTVEDADGCRRVTVHMFEGYSFCAPDWPDRASLGFVPDDVYPFPSDGSPLTLTPVPSLEPVPAP